MTQAYHLLQVASHREQPVELNASKKQGKEKLIQATRPLLKASAQTCKAICVIMSQYQASDHCSELLDQEVLKAQ